MIPLDFFLDKRNLTTEELQMRFSDGGMELFYKDCPEDGNQKIVLAPGMDPFQDFSYRFICCRNMIVQMIEPRLKTNLENKIILHLPRSLMKLKKYDELLRHYKTSTNSKDLRKLFRVVAVLVWSNKLGGVIEGQIMDILKIVYKQQLVGSKNPLPIRRKFGHIARLVIRVKGSHVVAPFRCV